MLAGFYRVSKSGFTYSGWVHIGYLPDPLLSRLSCFSSVRVRFHLLSTKRRANTSSGGAVLMAAAAEKLDRSHKRKRDPSAPAKEGLEKHKKSSTATKSPSKESKKPSNFQHSKQSPADAALYKEDNRTPREKRLAAKEIVEARKKRRKPNYNLEKDLTMLWEKMRRHNITKEERSKWVSEALKKMSGKFLEIASSHVTARVLQTCFKYCSQAEREIVFEALRPHLLTLSRKKYAVHLVKKVLDGATKKQLEGFICSLHGHVASLLRHMVGSAVVEHTFNLANASQKQSLLMEMYSTELQLFKDLTLTNTGRLVDIISKLGLQKSSVIQHMGSVIQPLLEKGIVEYSIVHTALVEYFTIADRSSSADVIQQLIPRLLQESAATDDAGQDSAPQFSRKRKYKRNKLRVPLIVRMMRTREGLKIGILCFKHATANERKKIIKGIKGHVRNLALDPFGSLFLVCIVSVVDDKRLVTKIVISELRKMVKELILDRNGRRTILQLLHPFCPRYFGPDDLACLNLSVPSLITQGEGADAITKPSSNSHSDVDAEITGTVDDSIEEVINMRVEVEGKKEPSLRRYELLVESQLAEDLIGTSIEHVAELLRSNFGREVIYEVAVGGTDGVLQSLADRVADLHNAIASEAALEKTDEPKADEQILENFHSSRTIRKLVLDSAPFASILWKTALAGKCEMWVQGHSRKIVAAFLESSDSKVRKMVKSELQPLIDRGILKAPEKLSKEVEA